MIILDVIKNKNMGMLLENSVGKSAECNFHHRVRRFKKEKVNRNLKILKKL